MSSGGVCVLLAVSLADSTCVSVAVRRIAIYNKVIDAQPRTVGQNGTTLFFLPAFVGMNCWYQSKNDSKLFNADKHLTHRLDSL